jgi:hypothetical protein
MVKIHLSWLVFVFVFTIIDSFISFTCVHRHVDLLSILSLLHMQRLILVIYVTSIQGLVCSSSNCWSTNLTGSSFDSSFDGLVLSVENLIDITLYLFSLRLNIFNSKGNYCSTYLHCHCVVCLQTEFIFQQNDRSEFRCVVLNIETIMFTFYDSMTS